MAVLVAGEPLQSPELRKQAREGDWWPPACSPSSSASSGHSWGSGWSPERRRRRLWRRQRSGDVGVGIVGHGLELGCVRSQARETGSQTRALWVQQELGSDEVDSNGGD